MQQPSLNTCNRGEKRGEQSSGDTFSTLTDRGIVNGRDFNIIMQDVMGSQLY